MDRDIIEYEPLPEDEREVPLEVDEETLPPPTVDPDERIEEVEEPVPGLDDERVD